MHASPCSHWLLGAAVACLLLLGWPLVPTHAALSSLLLIVPTARPLPRPAVASGPPPSAMLGAGRAHPASPRQPQAQTPIRTLHYSAGAGSRAEPRSHRILSPAPDLGQALLGGCAVAIGALTACMAVRRRSQPPAVVGSARRLRPVTSGWGWSPAVWVGHPRLHVLTAPWALMAVGPAPSDAGEGAAGDPLQDARLLVLDTLVPGQRLEVEAHATLQELLAGLGETPLVVVGRERLTLNRRGVEVVAVTGPDPGADRLLLVTTGRVAEVCDGGGDEGSRWAGRAGSVRWLGTLAADDAVLSPDDAAAAAALPSDDQPSLEVSVQCPVPDALCPKRSAHRHGR